MPSKQGRIVLGKRMLIEKSLMPKKAIEKRYKVEIFKESMCDNCDNKPLRPNDLCNGCEGFIAAYKLYKEKEKAWSVPQGDFLALSKVLERKGIDFKVVDKRKAIPFDNPIKWTGKLFGEGHIDENGIKRVNQKKVLKQWFKYETGILQAKPRSGKTPMSVYASIRLGQKTVVLCDRFELINQFYKTYMGDPKKGRPAMSNIPKLQKKTGKEIIREATKPKDLLNLEGVDILLINYQKLVRRPEDFAKIVNGKFSILIVDEVHGSGAEGYLRVVSNCSVRHRLSLTATPRRKDNRHRLVERIMGPVVAKSDASSLIPALDLYYSQSTPKTKYKSWMPAMNWLCSNKGLRVELIKNIFKDLRDGHKVIIVPLDRKNHIDAMVKMVNHQARKNNAKRGEKWPKDLAIKFYNGVNREEVLDKVDDGKPRVLFAIRSMIKQGIDFALPSKMHVFIPMSASNDRETGAPMFEQLSNRVCTPAVKKAPEITIWVHNVQMFRSCVIGLGWNEIATNRYNGKEGKYRIAKNFFEQLKDLSKQKAKTKASSNAKSFNW